MGQRADPLVQKIGGLAGIDDPQVVEPKILKRDSRGLESLSAGAVARVFPQGTHVRDPVELVQQPGVAELQLWCAVEGCPSGWALDARA